MLQLEVLNSQAKGKRFKLKSDITVGSAENCTIRIQHKDLLPVHARLFTNEDGKHYVEVNDDEAHVFVNNKDVLSSELIHDDQLKIGPLRFKVVDTEVA